MEFECYPLLICASFRHCFVLLYVTIRICSWYLAFSATNTCPRVYSIYIHTFQPAQHQYTISSTTVLQKVYVGNFKASRLTAHGLCKKVCTVPSQTILRFTCQSAVVCLHLRVHIYVSTVLYIAWCIYVKSKLKRSAL